MKFLVPVARISLEDCQQMAAAFAQHHCDTRQAGQLYAAWRDGSPVTRQRLLDQPELFFKAQRQVEPKPPSAPVAELLRDLEMVLAMVNRASRRLEGAGMDGSQCEEARRQIDRARRQLSQMTERMEKEPELHVEPVAAHHDSGTAHPGSGQARDRADVGNLPSDGAQSSSLELHRRAGAAPSRESRTLPATDPGALERLQGESGAGP